MLLLSTTTINPLMVAATRPHSRRHLVCCRQQRPHGACVWRRVAYKIASPMPSIVHQSWGKQCVLLRWPYRADWIPGDLCSTKAIPANEFNSLTRQSNALNMTITNPFLCCHFVAVWWAQQVEGWPRHSHPHTAYKLPLMLMEQMITHVVSNRNGMHKMTCKIVTYHVSSSV